MHSTVLFPFPLHSLEATPSRGRSRRGGSTCGRYTAGTPTGRTCKSPENGIRIGIGIYEGIEGEGRSNDWLSHATCN